MATKIEWCCHMEATSLTWGTLICEFQISVANFYFLDIFVFTFEKRKTRKVVHMLFRRPKTVRGARLGVVQLAVSKSW